MRFLRYDFRAGPSDIIEVTLDKQANVRLLDPLNFQRYRQGRDHRYIGGLALASPVRVSPPHDGQWHVVVDLGGYSGTLHASARLIRHS